MIGKRYTYTQEGRAGECLDVSTDGKWLLLLRDETKRGEQPQVAVMLADPDLKEIESD